MPRRLPDAPPDDWVDEVAVDRATTGHPVGRQLTLAERRVVARALLAQGHGASLISVRCAISGTTARSLVANLEGTAE